MSTDWQGGDGTDDPDRLRRVGQRPPQWDSWPIEQQVDWLTHQHNRRALILKLLARFRVEPEFQEHGEKEIITVEELAELYIKSERGNDDDTAD